MPRLFVMAPSSGARILDPIGGTSELEICRFERAGGTGEVEHLKPEDT